MVNKVILEALDEAYILESARDQFDKDHMIFVASKLSDMPVDIVADEYLNLKFEKYDIKGVFS